MDIKNMHRVDETCINELIRDSGTVFSCSSTQTGANSSVLNTDTK